MSFNPLNYPLCFEKPLRLSDITSWHEHIPFAFTIVGMLKPNIFVELGTHKGDSYCAFCQAVNVLGLDTACYAIDTWKGDEHAGFYSSDILEELRTYHDSRYKGFSQLIQSRFEDALDYFLDGSIDLIHIDGCHTYDAVKNDFETWLPKMSQCGVVLFHDINVHERDFGVWKFWEEVAERYPCFEFKHGYGLGVIAVGTEVSEEVLAFLNMGGPEVVITTKLYSYLGDKISLGHQLQSRDTQVTELTSALQSKDAQITELNDTLQVRDAQITELNSALQAKDAQVTELNDTLQVKDSQITELTSALQSKDAQIMSLENEIHLMHQSIMWRLTMEFHRRVVERICPANTGRRKIYDRGLKGGRTLVNEGLSSFWIGIRNIHKQKKVVYTENEPEKNHHVSSNQSDIKFDENKNVEQNKISELATKYIRGRGIHIGRTNQILRVPENVDMLNINCEVNNAIKEDIFDTLHNNQFNFCIFRNISEKEEDPLNILKNCLRSLKPGGILYLEVPTDKILSSQYGYKKDNLVEENLELNHSDQNPSIENDTTIKYHFKSRLNQYHSKNSDLFTVVEYPNKENNGKKEHVYIIEKWDYLENIFRLLELNYEKNYCECFEIDIIIPVYNAFEDLIKCLYSILVHHGNFRTIIINDKSTDTRINDLLLKLKPFESKNFVLLENSENKGFVKTVNRGMKFSKNDVILLNSDTIVTSNWTRKLKKCAYFNVKIATVTPFTNNGTICSIPNFCETNEIPAGYTIDAFADFIEQISLRKYPEIPTAIGFCMYIKREVLDKVGYFDEETFGKGYGEENDFCMKVIKSGYKNILCDDTFIYHREGSSFLDVKEVLSKKNLEILSKRYPEYLPMVAEFCQLNPLIQIHENIKQRMSTWNSTGKNKRILYVLHQWGGGTEKHVLDSIKLLDKSDIAYIIQVINNRIILTEFNNNHKLKYIFPLSGQIDRFTIHNGEYKNILEKVLNTFQINIIHIHHLIGHTFDIFDVAKEHNIPLLFTIHDYYAICPRINLLDENNIYCHHNNNMDKCSLCLSKSLNLSYKFINQWRSHCTKAFDKCDEIIVPTQSVIKILSKYYPNINNKSHVIEHGHDNELVLNNKCTFNESKANKVFQIGYIGGLSPVKGREIFYNLTKSNKLKNKVKWAIYGISDLHSEPGYYPDLNVTVYGKYRGFNELKEYVQNDGVDLIIFPSLCPESFSYTLSEAWALGVPVLVSNLGALKERVEKTGGGWIVDVSDTSIIEKKILDIINSPNDYMEKKNAVEKIQLKTLDENKRDYTSLYDRYITSPKPVYDSKFILSNSEICEYIKKTNQDFIPEIGDSTENLRLFDRFYKCLKENGLRYTIKRVIVYHHHMLF